MAQLNDLLVLGNSNLLGAVNILGNITAPTFVGALSGNADTATKFKDAQLIELTGDITGKISSQAGWTIATTLANSGATAGSYGPSADKTPGNGGTFTIPYFTVDAKGRITAASTKTITLPSYTVNNAKITIAAGSGLTTGGDFTVNQSSAETITLNVGAGTGISVTDNAVALAASGVTAGSYGPSANAAPAYSGTFTVPYVTVDTYGRVTGAANKTITIPAVPSVVSRSQYLETWYTDKSKTYGSQYPIYGWWETNSVCKLTVDNYQTKVDQAVAFAAAASVALTGDVTGSASSTHGWSVATTLANSGVTAGSYGPSANASPAHGGTFKVPYVTFDAKGRATAASTKTITLPSDRLFTTLVPTGTAIPANANLNTTTYMKVGRYYCSKTADAATITNCPLSVAFMMEVYSPLSTTIDNETTGTWVYRIRKITAYNTGVTYIQYANVGNTANTWTYGDWYVVPRSPFTLDSTDKNGGSAALGSATQPIYVTSNGTLETCTYTLGKSVPSNAVFTDTNYYHTRAYSSGLKISTGTGVSDMYVPVGTTSALGVVKQHTAADCTSYTSDDGATTPAAVKKAFGLFGTFYGVCDTAAGTAAKTVTVTPDTFVLQTGAQVTVKFTNVNSVASPTLNVNSTGAKPIYQYGTTAAGTGSTTTGWRAGAIVTFTYDGAGWIRSFFTNSTYTVNNATITIAAGNGLTDGGAFTTNQSSAETITLNVGAGSGITVAADTVSVNTSYTTSGKNYKVQVDSTSGGLYVNVPWTDNNTTYTAGNGLTLSSTTLAVGAGTGISVAADTVSLAIPYSMSSSTSTTPTSGTIVWYYGS